MSNNINNTQETLGDTIVNDNMQIDFNSIKDINVDITVNIGKTKMTVSELLKLRNGCILKLDKTVGESLEVFINNKLVAKGDIVVVDNQIGVILTEIIK